MQKTILVERDVEARMRDGVILRADVYRPALQTRCPVLLQRTLYNKNVSDLEFALMAAERGYAVVLQDTRGRYASEGDGRPFIHENEDGFDTVEWAAHQTWSDGQVGMFGSSFVGYTQWAAAVMQPPALKTIIPGFTFSDPHATIFHSGALILGITLSLALTAGALEAVQHYPGSPSEKVKLFYQWISMVDGMAGRETFRFSPLAEMPLVGKGQIAPYFYELISHPVRDSFWEAISCPLNRIHIPVFHIGGWYDMFIDQTWRDFSTLIKQGSAPQKLLVGPWTHANYSSLVGDFDFGVQASGMLVRPYELQLRWFDYWLKGVQNGILEEPLVSIFTMGENVWKNINEVPGNDVRQTVFFLHADEPANGSGGKGRLDQAPVLNESPDTYVFDPNTPVPTCGGSVYWWPPAVRSGVLDQSPVEDRTDVLVYTSPALERDLEITGQVQLDLWAASSAIDTDFTAKLVDLEPGGYARNIVDGIQRARYRVPGSESAFLHPGEPTELVIDLGVTSHVLKAGHSLRLEVSSSNFPRFDRNANTGLTFGEDVKFIPARQTVFHDSAHPSRLLIPVVSNLD